MLMSGVTSHFMMTVAFLLLVFGSSAAAQGRQGCTVVTLSDPPRDVIRCPGLKFEAERATQYRLIDRNQDGAPEGAQVTGGAVLIDVDPSRRGGFQIRTPHATAAVRGMSSRAPECGRRCRCSALLCMLVQTPGSRLGKLCP